MKEWFQEPREFGRVLTSLSRRKRSFDLDKPILNEYSSELNPVFLDQFRDIELFSLAPHWLIRDGVVPVLWFFSCFPVPPKNWKSHLFLHESLVQYVPFEWRKRVGTFQRVSTECRISQNTQRNRILLSGLMQESFCSIQSLDRQIKYLQTCQTQIALSNSKIFSLLVPESRFVGFSKDLEYQMQYREKIHKVFAAKTKWIQPYILLKMTDMRNFAVIDFNEGLVIVDNFVEHYVLSYGGTVFKTCPELSLYKNSTSEYFPISPYHGFRIAREFPVVKWKNHYEKYLKKKFLKFKTTEVLLPWPKPLLSWVRSWHSQESANF